MNKYFIYYSLTGNGDLIAYHLAKKGFTTIKVEPVKPINRNVNFFRIMKYGFLAGLKKKAKIKDIELDLKEDDVVIIGSPIWNDRLSTPINGLLDKMEFDKEKTKFIVYPAGEKAKKVVKQLADLGYKNPPIILSNPLKHQDTIADLLEF